MDGAGADLGDEVEERIRTHGAHGRHAQTENENREQQNAAPDSRHSDEGPNSKTNQALDQQIHDQYRVQPSTYWRRAVKPTPPPFR